ncbi:MAG: hypothetical protein ABI120_21165 [Gemmatimonadaceae bacterium]
MRTYIALTGTLFGLIVIAHIARGIQEGSSIYDPWYVALTSACAALSVWAVMLLRKTKS